MKNPINTSGLLLCRLSQFSRLSAKIIERGLKPIGITLQEMRIAGLMMGESHITQKDLAGKLSVRAATLSVTITKLEKDGLVKKRPSDTDKRVQFLTLQASEKFAQVDQLLVDLDAQVSEGISEKDLAVTYKVVARLIQNVNEMGAKS
jgi:MarR family transcriptional regulator for hemolysin